MLLHWRLHSKHIILFIINIKNIQPDISLLAPPHRFKKRLNSMWSKRVAAWSGEQKFGLSPLHCQDWAGIAAVLQSAVPGFN